jgi:endoribonuclease Dicer
MSFLPVIVPILIVSQRESNYDNFVEYCKARRKGFEGLQKYDQPLIEVSKVPTVLNHLNPTSRPVTTSTKSPAKCA